MNGTLIILFGATGELSRRKLIPALYRLIVEKKLHKVAFLFTGREQSSVESLFDAVQPEIDSIDQEIWQFMIQRSIYCAVDVSNAESYNVLYDLVITQEQQWHTSNRLVYCAVASDFFCSITRGIVNASIVEYKNINSNPWHHIVYEKPFGKDKQSAHAINTCIASTLAEHQVFRIDHYLTKEIVNNIALIRFTNCIFEPLWNNTYIDYVEIILSETLPISSKSTYYDTYGALRDVVQNHMLQLLALIAMEAPIKLTGEYIRDKKANVLSHVSFVDGILGQYEGYRKDINRPASETETFAALELAINNKRWAGVPFFLRTGKCLQKKETVINIMFKSVTCLLTKQCPPAANMLSIRVAPDATFSLTLNAKNPAEIDTLIPIAMEYCHSCRFILSPSHEYEFLLQEVMRGEQSVSVRFDEIEHAWHIIDSIYAKKLPIYIYKQNTIGPAELNQFYIPLYKKTLP
ncbi:MAG TPA: glucose-6-phosphate dehydrogenase [Candidatus Babeliales bacterium]|jgi:glucose-6-phosphate 1-dehydrogenase|nr:glucose-6-phosphate dehydrogenase [Candidatus Babeliales bacterium]